QLGCEPVKHPLARLSIQWVHRSERRLHRLQLAVTCHTPSYCPTLASRATRAVACSQAGIVIRTSRLCAVPLMLNTSSICLIYAAKLDASYRLKCSHTFRTS